MSLFGFSNGLDDDNPMMSKRHAENEAKFDITAMIDLVFMMNIFFLVTTVGAALAEIDLPTAKHCAPADPETSTIITITGGVDGAAGLVYIGNGTSSTPLVDIPQQERAVREAIEEGVRAGRMTVLIKAEKTVRLRDVGRVGRVAAGVPGTELKVSVVEQE